MRLTVFSVRVKLLLVNCALLAGCASQPLLFPVTNPPSAVLLAPLERNRPLLGLALGGGASRGFAHVGVIRTLEANGIIPDIIVGTSAGSFVGALYAAGYDGAELEKIAFELTEEALRDVIFPNRGFVKGERVQDVLNQYLKNRPIEKLSIRFGVVAAELRSGNPIVFTQGNTGLAVRASSSIPGIFQPALIQGTEYIDGGVISPVPIKATRSLGADIVIGVDVANKPSLDEPLESTASILLQSIAIMTNTLSNFEATQADVVIQPDVSDIGTVDFTQKLLAIRQGVDAALQQIPRIRLLLGLPPAPIIVPLLNLPEPPLPPQPDTN